MIAANWHMATPVQQLEDPFAEVVAKGSPSTPALAQITPIAQPVQDGAFAQLRDLVRAEGRLADADKTCPLKDQNWSQPTCKACPERGSRGPLCLIGVAQETLLAA